MKRCAMYIVFIVSLTNCGDTQLINEDLNNKAYNNTIHGFEISMPFCSGIINPYVFECGQDQGWDMINCMRSTSVPDWGEEPVDLTSCECQWDIMNTFSLTCGSKSSFSCSLCPWCNDYAVEIDFHGKWWEVFTIDSDALSIDYGGGSWVRNLYEGICKFEQTGSLVRKTYNGWRYAQDNAYRQMDYGTYIELVSRMVDAQSEDYTVVAQLGGFVNHIEEALIRGTIKIALDHAGSGDECDGAPDEAIYNSCYQASYQPHEHQAQLVLLALDNDQWVEVGNREIRFREFSDRRVNRIVQVEGYAPPSSDVRLELRLRNEGSRSQLPHNWAVRMSFFRLFGAQCYPDFINPGKCLE